MEPTIYKPTIYNASTIYKTGAEGGGGGGGGNGIACIRCLAIGSYYYEIPITCASNSTFEMGFNLVGDWGKNQCGVFAGYGSTYYPPIAMRAENPNTSSFGIRIDDYQGTRKNFLKLYPENFNFYHVKVYPKNGNDNTISAIDLQGNEKTASMGGLLGAYPIDTIRLFVYTWALNGSMSGFEIYYFRVIDSNEIILDLVPDEQNGVPGFTDNISGNFYAPNNSAAFEAVKPRAPL